MKTSPRDIVNEKYNVKFELELNCFSHFFESLKKSKEYYHNYCNLQNINIIDFDNEYLDTINILKSELLKYYILVTNNLDNDIIKYIIIDNNYIDFYKKIFQQTNTPYYNYKFITFDIMNKLIDDSRSSHYINEECFAKKYEMCGSLRKITEFECDLDYKYLTIIQKLKKVFNTSLGNGWDDYNKIKNNYLNSLKYETIYDREFYKLIIHLPSICLGNLENKEFNIVD